MDFQSAPGEKKMSMDLLVSVSESGIVGETSLQLSPTKSISEILNLTISKLLTESAESNGQDWALFFPKRSVWLNSNQTLAFYNLPEKAR